MAGPETIEFRHEFVRETFSLMQRRLKHFVYVIGGIWLLVTLLEWWLGVVVPAISPGDGGDRAIHLKPWNIAWRGVDDLMMAAGFVAALSVARRLKSTNRAALVASIGLVSLYGVHLIVADRVVQTYESAWLLFAMLHVLACIHFPWTTLQALIPIAIFAAVALTYNVADTSTSVAGDMLRALSVTLAGVPGVIICSVQHEWRERNFGYKMLHSRYGRLRDELASARRIHESLFPSQCLDGPVVLTYQYEPMRHIGGDYLHVVRHQRPDGSCILSVIVMDVTGHGVPAALTVNRLHGEVELLFADDPEVAPGQVLKALNRYVHLTLAKHSIYATALCLRVDPERNVVEAASGGHPPAFLLGVDGSMQEIAPTTFVLGACRDEDFESDAMSYTMHPGDTIVAYTDGAIEARTPEGAMLRIEGLRAMLAKERPAAGDWPVKLLSAVAAHRGGAATEDDTLVVEIHRPLKPAPLNAAGGKNGTASGVATHAVNPAASAASKRN